MPLTTKERDSYRARYNVIPVVVAQGGLLEITHVMGIREKRLPGRRGVIKGFTRAARLRMLRTIACINWDQCGKSVFITLTYPDELADRTNAERTRDRYLFLRSMEKHLDRKVGGLWRVEWQERKSGMRKGTLVPHVHVVLFNCRFISKEVVNDGWRRALNAEGRLITWIDGISSAAKTARYIAKYCAKAVETSVLDNASYLNTSGRHWGMHRRDQIPWADRWVCRLVDDRQLEVCENAAAMTFPFFNKGVRQGFSLFGPIAKKVIEFIFRTDLDEPNEPA
jgi:hypothetical protein